MTIGIGIALAFVTMLCWGFGDFLIQRSARDFGDWETLFVLSVFGSLVLAPFSLKRLPELFASGESGVLVLLIASAVLLVAALLQFESLKKGKISVIEPAQSLEIPTAALCALFILGERMSPAQLTLVTLLMISLMLVGVRSKALSRRILLEKGILIAVIGSIVMGSANFLIGWGSRVSDPVMVNFFTDTFLAIATALYLAYAGRFKNIWKDLRCGYQSLLPMAISDKAAWLAFAFSMSLAPIGIATALSESFVIVTVILGLAVNKEKLAAHQKIGLVGAIASAVILASVTA